MKQKTFFKKYGLAIVVLLAAILVGTYIFVNKNTDATAEADSQLAQKTPGEAEFSFAGADGWWQGATDHVSMALFQESEQGCFVSAEHHHGSLKADKSQRDASNKSLVDDGYTVTAGPSMDMELKTSKGSVNYQLDQTHIVSPDGADKIKGGLATGYVDLSGNGYLFMMANCDEPDQLAGTLVALKAIRFEAAE